MLKVQMEFRMGHDGWSEIVYATGDSPKAFKAAAQLLVAARIKCLVKVADIHHVRISRVGGGSRSYRFPPNPSRGKLASAIKRDVGGVTIVVGCYGEDNAYRSYKLHGCPDTSAVYTEDGDPGTALGDDRKGYLTFLVENQYLIRHVLEPATLDTLPTVHDVSINNNIVTFVLTGSVANGTKKIIVSGMKGFGVRQFNGPWTVASLTTTGGNTTITAGTTRSLDPRINYVPDTGRVRIGGTAAFSGKKYLDFDDFEVYSTRKTGRPTDEHPGRRSSRR